MDGSANLQATVDGRPLRILMPTARYLPEHGGTEIHTYEVAQRLASYGADVTVLTTARAEPFARVSHEGAVRVLRVRAWPSQRDYYFAPGLARIIRESGADIVHCQGYHTFVAPVVMLAALSAKIPYVLTFHSGGHSSRVRQAIRPVQARALRPLLRRARKLISSTLFEADRFARAARMPATAFAVIPSGSDLPAPRADDGMDDGPPVVLSLGRVESYKGHQRVVEALPALERARPGLHLRIVGSGPYEAELLELAEELGVAHMLTIAPVPADRRDEMAQLLQRAGCVVTLSEYESQGMAVHEAHGLGRPLLVSDNSALADLGDHANVCSASAETNSDEIAATIVELLEAPPLPARRPLSTWDDCATALLEVYLEALARHP
ncbi:MAG TPA: glycosyltransferase family 4 protein [Solirubrobacteraceae bacterium]|nr:glycosyltransferase family 4 protein [Solirubrobacteraceae bacterium]